MKIYTSIFRTDSSVEDNEIIFKATTRVGHIDIINSFIEKSL